MPSVQRTPGDHNVTSGAPWVGEVSFLQNDHGVLDMLVQKMDMHRRPCCRSSRESLNQAAPRASLGQEGCVICPWFFPHGKGFQTPYLLFRSRMLCHHVPCHRSSRHLIPALPVLHPYLLLLLVQGSLSRNLLPIRRLRLRPCRLEWAVDQSDCLSNISMQAHPI